MGLLVKYLKDFKTLTTSSYLVCEVIKMSFRLHSFEVYHKLETKLCVVTL